VVKRAFDGGTLVPVTIEKISIGFIEKFTPEAGVARLAQVLGWDHVPQLTEEEEREIDRRMDEAQAAARRLYGLPEVPA